MAENRIGTTISPKELSFIPGETPAQFEVAVRNDSERYTSFQLEVLADYQKSKQTANWYRISPEVSTKNPPGALTNFNVEIIDTPVPGFIGLINLTVRVFSVEMSDEDREILRLNVEKGSRLLPLQIKIPVENFQVFPSTTIEIPVEVYNPNQQKVNTYIKLLGLDSTWQDYTEHQLQLDANEKGKKTLVVKIPNTTQALKGIYPFKIEATILNAQSNSSYIGGTIEVLPQGCLDFSRTPELHQIPNQGTWWKFWRSDPVIFELAYENQSNVNQNVSVEIQGEDQQPCTFTVSPESTQVVPGKIEKLFLEAKCRRPWLGQTELIGRVVHAIWSERQSLDTRNESKNIEIVVKPIIPVWLQAGGAILLLYLLWWLLVKPPTTHKAAVMSVKFNGVGERIISASDDQTILGWKVNGFDFLQFWVNPRMGEIGNAGKAVRVVRYRPIDNNFVAAGLENGEIRLWDLLDHKVPPQDFAYRKDDRVLALEYTEDSRYLFSGHGSGLVLQWDLEDGHNRAAISARTKKVPINQKQFDFAVYSLKFIGKDSINLAIGGRFNSLKIWNWRKQEPHQILYPQLGGKDDYIESLATAESNPNLLASADNQGYITIWNIQDCIEGNKQSCGQVVDRWDNGHNKQPVRSIALSANGCYLVSGGDDGKVKFWPLTTAGRRAEKFNNRNGKEIGQSSHQQTFYSLDIKTVQNDVLVASGSKDTWVRLHKEKRLPDVGCDRLN